MDRKTVAQTLGVSEKTVSRYVAAGRLPDVRKNGALDIAEADVLRLKAELEAPVITARDNETGQERTAIVVVPRARGIKPGNALAVIEGVTRQRETGQEKPFVPVADKLLLNLEDARALTGLSRGVLVDAIKAGELRALTIGRGYKLRPDDIEDWIEKMFKSASKGKK